MDSKYSKNIPLMYISTFFSSMVFHRGIFILYLLERGISNTQVGILQTSLFWANFLFEIPTGILGDKIGRKWSIVIGLLLTLINSVGMAFSDNFFLFFALFIIEGAAFAFRSGSNTALLYDSLKILKREGEYVRILSRISTISAILLGIGMGAGGFIKALSWQHVYLAYAAAVLLSSFCVLLMHENVKDFSTEHKNEHGTMENLKVFFSSVNGKHLLLFLLSLGIYNATMTPYYVYGQNLFKEYGLTESSIGLIFCVIQISTGIIYMFAEKVSKQISFNKLIVLTMVFSSLLMFMNIFNNFFVSLIVFYSVMVFPDIADIVIDNFIQGKIPSHIRASLLSAKTFFESIFTGLGYLFFGFMFEIIGISKTYVLMGLFPLISLFLFEFYFKIAKSHHELIEE